MSFKLPSTKFNNIKSMIDKFKGNENYELETRFLGKNFVEENLNISKFTSTLNHFIYGKDSGGLGLNYNVKSQLVINDEYDKNKRLIINGSDNVKKYWLNGNLEDIDYEFIRKESLEKIDVNEYSVRFSLAEETELDRANETIEYLKNSNKESLKMYRLKNRYEVFSENGLIRIDFTSVKQSDRSYKSFRDSNTIKANVNHEIEVELLHNDKIEKMSSDDIFKEYMRINYLILSLIQHNKSILNITESNNIIKNYNSLVNVSNKNLKKNKKAAFIAANPVTLHVENIDKTSNLQNIYNKYAVTLKADGERRLMYVNTDGAMYLFDVNFNVYNLSSKAPKGWENTLFECELISDAKLLLFYDALFSKGVDIRRTHLKVKPSERTKTNIGRLGHLDKFLTEFKKSGVNGSGLSFEEKKYLFSVMSDGSDIFAKAKELWCDRKSKVYETDGLIFVPIKEHYPLHSGSWYSLFKWKPSELNTIDFLVKIVLDENGNDARNPFILEVKGSEGEVSQTLQQYKTLQLFVGGKKRNINKNNKFKYSYEPILFNPVDDDNSDSYNRANIFIDSANRMFTETGKREEIKSNTIVEFGYDPKREEGFRWVAHRVRHDKTQSYKGGQKVYGNNENIANDIFRSLIVPVTEDMIVTGVIPEAVKKRAEEIKTKNVNNSHNNAYYNTINNSYNPKNRNSYQNFHNIWIKENLYRKVAPAKNGGKPLGRLLDLGSGKGGDIPKWKRSKYAYVLGIEQDIKNIEYAKNLYSKIGHPKPKVFFVRGDISRLIFPDYDAGLTEANKVNLQNYMPSKFTFDVVSIQFALHYLFKNEIVFRTLMQNVTDNLAIGGYFIGTCFNGKRVFDKLKGKKKIEGKHDGKTLWSIEKKYGSKGLPNSKSTFGREIDVFVSSIGKTHTEYLVNFTYMDEVLKEYGFEKVEVKSFSDYFDEMVANGKKNLKNIANGMTPDEKEFSFLNSAFIYKKTENTPDSVFSKLVKMIKKADNKEMKAKAKDEVKETMEELGVEEVTEPTEELIESDEVDDSNMNTDLESDIEIE